MRAVKFNTTRVYVCFAFLPCDNSISVIDTCVLIDSYRAT